MARASQDGDQRSWTLLVELAGTNPTKAAIESTRRALDTLAKAGVVELDWVARQIPGWSYTGTVTRHYLAARMTPNPLTQAKIDAVKEQKRAELEAKREARRAQGQYGIPRREILR